MDNGAMITVVLTAIYVVLAVFLGVSLHAARSWEAKWEDRHGKYVLRQRVFCALQQLGDETSQDTLIGLMCVSEDDFVRVAANLARDNRLSLDGLSPVVTASVEQEVFYGELTQANGPAVLWSVAEMRSVAARLGIAPPSSKVVQRWNRGRWP